MNIEIAFRAKPLGINNFVYGYFCKDFEEKAYITTLDGVDTYTIDVKTLGKFTGLKDKNGVEIYFDDIIKFKGNYTESSKCGYFVGRVDFDGFKIVLKSGELEWDAREETEGFDYTSEVIGNIHQNPELI